MLTILTKKELLLNTGRDYITYNEGEHILNRIAHPVTKSGKVAFYAQIALTVFYEHGKTRKEIYNHLRPNQTYTPGQNNWSFGQAVGYGFIRWDKAKKSYVLGRNFLELIALTAYGENK